MHFKLSQKIRRPVIAALLFVVVAGGVFAPFAASPAHGTSHDLGDRTIRVNNDSVGSGQRPGSDAPPVTITPGNESTPTCDVSVFSVKTHFSIEACMAHVGNAMLQLSAWVLWAGGYVLDEGVHYSVIRMNEFGNLDAIQKLWTIFRDLGNIIIIFAFLVIGIATILRISSYGWKTLLAQLIVVALLINFSLVAAKVVIDVGNVMAFQIYDQLVEDRGSCNRSAPQSSTSDETPSTAKCLSGQLMDKVSLTTIFKVDISKLGTGAQAINADKIDFGTIFLASVLGSGFLLVTAFVFFAGGIMLLFRVVLLIILMILSPIGFAATAIPATANLARQWWGTLFRQVFFVPIFLLMTLIAFRAIDGAKSIVSPSLDTDSFAAAFQGYDVAASVLIYFVIAIGFMLFALVSAQKMGAYGSSAMMKLGQNTLKWGRGAVLRGGGAATAGLAGYAGRSTIGRAFSKLADSEKLKERAAKKGIGGMLARAQLKTYQSGAGASYDARRVGGVGKKLGIGEGAGKGGYKKTLENQVKRREAVAKDLGSASKTSEERSREVALIQAIDKAEKDLLEARKEKDDAAEEAAKERIATAKEQLDDHLKLVEKDRAERGTERKRTYANTLASQRSPALLWTKVSRKDKEAADKIRKGKSAAQKILDDLREATAETPPAEGQQQG